MLKSLFAHTKTALKNSSWLRIFLIFIAMSFVVRGIFLFLSRSEIDLSALLLIKIFALGFFFDVLACGYIALVPMLYGALMPNRFFNHPKHQKFLAVAYFIFLYVITFACFSEWFFWDEFQARFNFIAVDYLIYTTEVVGNIVESYPMEKLLVAILLIAAGIFFVTRKKIVKQNDESVKLRVVKFGALAKIMAVAFFLIDSSKLSQISENKFANEVSTNGIYQLFSAYRNNQIDYDSFYAGNEISDSLATLRHLIAKNEPRSKFLNKDDISRFIPKPNSDAPEQKFNVIFVSIESFSADFMKAFGNEENLTPNLDAVAKNGLFFTGLKATGTRTVRGLEALSLSVPPTPGNSILRRPNNENLFNISSPMKERGYEAKFLYGGDGYFDNMNYFFEHNGFEIVDRKKFSRSEISFENAWGVSDEDLFDKTIAEADKSHADGKPFLNFVMTTSNHRPFTYPDGKIDIASKTGRGGAVKYTDYAIGKLLEKARHKKWFNNTIFVFVADHCAGSAGNTDVPLWRYQIPAIFYAPKIIRPQVFDKNVSQIDLAPTLFGIMNWGYKSKFFGTDVLTNRQNFDQHSFVSTYTDLGYFKGDKLYLLKLKKEKKVFDVTLEKFGFDGSKEVVTEKFDDKKMHEAISYYQGASYLFQNDGLKNFDVREKN